MGVDRGDGDEVSARSERDEAAFVGAVVADADVDVGGSGESGRRRGSRPYHVIGDDDVQPHEAAEHVADATGDDGVAGEERLAVGREIDVEIRRLGILKDAKRLRRAREKIAARSGHEKVVQLVGPQIDGDGEQAVAVRDREHRNAARP